MDLNLIQQEVNKVMTLSVSHRTDRQLQSYDHLSNMYKDRLKGSQPDALKEFNHHSKRQCKLSPEQVKMIREKYVPYEYGKKKLSKEFGVSPSVIHRILNGKSWKSTIHQNSNKSLKQNEMKTNTIEKSTEGTYEKQAFGTKEWAPKNFNFIKGCQNSCKYCFAKAGAVRRKQVQRENWADEVIDMKKINKGYRKRDYRMMFPSTHDISPKNLKYTIIVLEKLLNTGQELLIVTKPHLSVVKTLCERFSDKKDQILFRFTIGSMDSNTLKFWEPFAPSFEERFVALKYAYYSGFETSVSCEPALDIYTQDLVELLLPYVTETIWIGLMNNVSQILSLNGEKNKETLDRVEQLKHFQTNEWVFSLYNRYKNNPKVEWKDSMKKIVGY